MHFCIGSSKSSRVAESIGRCMAGWLLRVRDAGLLSDAAVGIWVAAGTLCNPNVPALTPGSTPAVEQSE